MQIGIRLHDTADLSLEQRLATIKQQGFTCTHLALTKVINEFPVTSATLTPGYAMYLKKLFQRYDIDIAVLGCYLNLAEADTSLRENVLSTYKAHIRFASILGCGVVGTETPFTAINRKEHSTEAAMQTMLENLREIVTYAEKMGVILAIEPVRTHLVATPKLARQVLDTINSPNLQIIFDPVNLLEMDNYLEQTKVMEEAIDLLGDEVAVIHMKDFVIQEERMVAVAAGLGSLAYPPIMKFIKNGKPMIHCTLENTKPENAVHARDYIKSLWEKA